MTKALISGASVLLLGKGVNELIMALNGGMPVAIGQPYFDGRHQYVPLRTASWPLLGDVINIGEISYSIGDLLMYAGWLVCAIFLMKWLLRRETVEKVA